MSTPGYANGYAISGFVLSLICCSPLSIAFSAVALRQISKQPNQEGKGMATAGLILGIVGSLAWIVVLVVSMLTPFWSEFWIGFYEGFYNATY